MKKYYLTLCCLLLTLPVLFAQKLAHSGISRTNINLRGNAIVLGQVTISAPSAGKVILRFDGNCHSAPGDRIMLAASQTTKWGPNDDCVEVKAANTDANSNIFSHTRAYDVPAGDHVFYAVAQNFQDMGGTGVASVYGSLTAEWFPEIPGKAFARHQGFAYNNIFVEGAPAPFSALTIDAPVAGKVMVRFDGKCFSTHGDLIFLAANNAPSWTNYEGSTSGEVIGNGLDMFSFAHVRYFDVGPGSHTYYAVVENFFEVYGNGFVSVHGSLTVQFYPNEYAPQIAFTSIRTPFGVEIEGPPVAVGEVQVNAPTMGKVLVNFAGTCIGSNGDQIRLAASNVPDWAPEDGNLKFKPYSSSVNRTSFSHSRVYDIGPGNHNFYGVIQNYEDYEGIGIAVVYGSLTAKFFPEGASNIPETEPFATLRVSPNPSTDFVFIEYPELAREGFVLTLYDEQGRLLRQFEKSKNDYSESLQWDMASLPAGIYFIQINSAAGVSSRRVVKL
jgi:hypothetical protein